jgi:hypothetical protein
MKKNLNKNISNVVFDITDRYSLRLLTIKERIILCLQIRPESKFAAHDETNEKLMDDWKIPKYIIIQNK